MQSSDSEKLCREGMNRNPRPAAATRRALQGGTAEGCSQLQQLPRPVNVTEPSPHRVPRRTQESCVVVLFGMLHQVNPMQYQLLQMSCRCGGAPIS